MNFHYVRVGSKRVLIGNGSIHFHKMGHRRRSPCATHIVDRREVLRSVLLVGRTGIGTIHADRCPGIDH